MVSKIKNIKIKVILEGIAVGYRLFICLQYELL